MTFPAIQNRGLTHLAILIIDLHSNYAYTGFGSGHPSNLFSLSHIIAFLLLITSYVGFSGCSSKVFSTYTDKTVITLIIRNLLDSGRDDRMVSASDSQPQDHGLSPAEATWFTKNRPA